MGFTAKALTCVDRRASEMITVGWDSTCIQPAEAGSRARASRERERVRSDGSEFLCRSAVGSSQFR
jgi:hypothetical protein